MEEAHRLQESAGAQKICRQLAETTTGKGNFFYHRPPPARLDPQEWANFLAKPGHEGGLNAQEIDFEKEAAEVGLEEVLAVEDNNAVTLGNSDYKGISKVIKKQKLRKAFPKWDLPTEI